MFHIIQEICDTTIIICSDISMLTINSLLVGVDIIIETCSSYLSMFNFITSFFQALKPWTVLFSYNATFHTLLIGSEPKLKE